MALSAIREITAAALRHEEATGEYRTGLADRLPALRTRLVLPDDAPLDALMAFITRYVRSVPGCLRLVTAVSLRRGFHDYAEPFLAMAEEYFLRPPDEVAASEGLGALLDEAFLAQRLLEEVNDHHVRHLQQPLLPVDMTEANTIVHHLLGDPLASRLEALVQHTAEGLLGREHVWKQVKALPGSAPSPLVSTARVAGPDALVRLRIVS